METTLAMFVKNLDGSGQIFLVLDLSAVFMMGGGEVLWVLHCNGF